VSVYFAGFRRPHGTAAQWVCLPERQAVALPEAVGFDLGAPLGIPALTAHRAVFSDGPVAG
jgi:NADPH:quinone reductase